MLKRVSGLLFVALLVLSTVPAVSAQPVAKPAAVAAARDPRAKIHPNLLRDVEMALRPQTNARGSGFAGASKDISFMARIVAGTDLSAYTSRWFARKFVTPDGTTVAVGFASPAGILKLASEQNVLSLQRPESLVDRPQPLDDDASALNKVAPADVLKAGGAKLPPGPEPTGWYHTGPAIHRSQQAWQKGYTGTGVKLMINDSGADYCHPDLEGTYAYVEDSASPYYGLPMMFDSWSTYLSARDVVLGEANIANGLALYADTSATVTGSTASFQPLGAEEAHTYTLPGTSKSGTYHIGFHPDQTLASLAADLSEAFGDGSAVEGEHAAVLVVDGKTAGVYDTVYVDLNYNFDFSDDTPAVLSRDFKYSETACLDYNGDGLNDISGGLVYFISDGETALPTQDWYWGIDGDAYGNGDLVAFHYVDAVGSPGGDHGMGCTSVAVGQGIVRGSVYAGPSGPPQADGKGLVVGPGKNVKTTQNGDYYRTPFDEDAFVFASLGLDGEPGTDDDVQVISNSWGYSSTDNDGWDSLSRRRDLINRVLGPNLAILKSTGNGAPGYGTITDNTASTGIDVGASTLFDTIGLFDKIGSAAQIVGGDAMSWSNRGPGATGDNGVEVLATGAFGTGSVVLNEVADGSIATAEFSGTSMATPVAAGNLALIYQAWKERTGQWPSYAEARELLMSSARNVDHDVFSQGAGLVDADRGTDVAAGLNGIYAAPHAWRVGDYRGTEYEAFAHVIERGKSDTQTFTLYNPSPAAIKVDLRGEHFTKRWSKDYSFTSLDQSIEHGSSTTPDYVFRIDQDLPKDSDLLQIRLTKPYSQFDPDDDQTDPFSNWRIFVYNWTDLNGDGRYWTDLNRNGKVDLGGEMQNGEFIRFSYGYNTGPTQQVRVANPLQRKATGILVGLQHRNRLASVPRTRLTIEATVWKQRPWSWLKLDRSSLTVPANGSATFKATVSPGYGAPHGLYEGAVVASQSGRETVIPVTASVIPPSTKFYIGKGDNYSEPLLYNNSELYGYTDYSWRAESGDWRFYFADLKAADLPKTGTNYLVVDNTWSDPKSDIDTIIYGPEADCASNGANCENPLPSTFPGAPSVYGPYTLGEKGRSNNTHIGSGRWGYDTSSGGPREIVAAPATEGLHEIMLHQVKVGGDLNTTIQAGVGIANLSSSSIAGSGASGSAAITVNSDVRLLDFRAEGFGFGTPVTTQETVNQDDPNDPSTASFTREIEVKHSGLLEVSTGGATGNDLDLYVYGPDGSLVAASTTPTDEEAVSIKLPADGTYTIAVTGYSVPAGSTQFDLTINNVQGFDLSVTELPKRVLRGEPGTVKVAWNLTGKPAGTYYGLLLMGPKDAPGLFQVPVEITVP